jgi:hypothetical protein
MMTLLLVGAAVALLAGPVLAVDGASIRALRHRLRGLGRTPRRDQPPGLHPCLPRHR